MKGTARIAGPDGPIFENIPIHPFTKASAPRYAMMGLTANYALTTWNLHFLVRMTSFPNDGIHGRSSYAIDGPTSPSQSAPPQCTGKTLAYAELRYVAAILLRDYDIEFAPGYDQMAMWRDTREQATAQPGKAISVFKPPSMG
ncbi:hypothetical protein DL770_003719 [Monosporascus sp. CRB-9-2]|nr:hypothetical protein DL770_003719 [Monosporascus sp. CRB-9-2]